MKIKNKTCVKDIVKVLKDYYKENENNSYIKLSRPFKISKLKDYRQYLEDLILEIEDINLQIKKIRSACNKFKLEIRTKILL